MNIERCVVLRRRFVHQIHDIEKVLPLFWRKSLSVSIKITSTLLTQYQYQSTTSKSINLCYKNNNPLIVIVLFALITQSLTDNRCYRRNHEAGHLRCPVSGCPDLGWLNLPELSEHLPEQLPEWLPELLRPVGSKLRPDRSGPRSASPELLPVSNGWRGCWNSEQELRQFNRVWDCKVMF